MIRNTLFGQILQLFSRHSFKRCVDRYSGDRYTKSFNCWQQLIVFSMDEKKIKKVAGFLGLYYLLFAVYIQSPEAHSLLGDLYQGTLDSSTVLEGIHNHPSDSSHDFFDDHALWIVSIDKGLLCMIYSHSYPGTQKTSRKLLVPPRCRNLLLFRLSSSSISPLKERLPANQLEHSNLIRSSNRWTSGNNLIPEKYHYNDSEGFLDGTRTPKGQMPEEF